MEIAKKSWPLVETDLNWFVSNGLGKKIYLSQVRLLEFSEHPTIKYLPYSERLAIYYVSRGRTKQ